MDINLPSSNPQAAVAAALEQIGKLFLHEALANAIQAADLSRVNDELDRFAPKEDLRNLAASGVRGEFLFAAVL